MDSAALARARLLRSPGAASLSEFSFDMRRHFLVDGFEKKKYLKNDEDVDAMSAMDPAGMEQMTGMLKNNMLMLIPQTAIMSWVSFFFSGFVISEWIGSSVL
jgi:hypothetical protein